MLSPVIKPRMLLFPSVRYVRVVCFLRNLFIRTYFAFDVALPIMLLNGTIEFYVISKWFLSRLVSCLFCIFTVQAYPKLFTWNSCCDQLATRCWFGPNGTRQSQVCSALFFDSFCFTAALGGAPEYSRTTAHSWAQTKLATGR